MDNGGSLVWARNAYRRDQLWPGVILPLGTVPDYIQRLRIPGRLCVCFYGPSIAQSRTRDYFWLPAEEITAWTDYCPPDQPAMLKAHGSYKEDFETAHEEALSVDAGYLDPTQGRLPKVDPSAPCCLSCGKQLLPKEAAAAKEQGDRCEDCQQLYLAGQHCAVCSRVWFDYESSTLAQCKRCGARVHGGCDPRAERTIKADKAAATVKTEQQLDAMDIDQQQQQQLVPVEESLFYSQCLEKMVFSRTDSPSTMVEFGAGDGSPVISALLKSPPHLGRRVIHAYEISPKAARVASGNAARCGVEQNYVVHNSCFWKGLEETPAECLVANPPYLPAPDADIMMPGLWGGLDGAGLTRDLLSAGFDSAMLMISAYSNPVETLEHARDEGYAVTDFLITPLPFGTYSSEPKVKSWIEGMKAKGQAFYSSRMYFLAGVLFEKKQVAASKPDLYNELLKVLTAF